MLLQDHQGCIELFPAIPDEWRSRGVVFKNLRSRGGILISAAFLNGKINTLEVKSPNETSVVINGKTYVLKKGVNTLV